MGSTKFKGSMVQLSGNEIKVGDEAPRVALVTAELAEKEVGLPGRVQVLVVVPSLDTSVCAVETRKFNEKAAEIKEAEVVVISMDLPFASKRFCSTEGIQNLTVASDFRNKEFAKSYGVLIAEGPLAGLSCRAIFIVGKDGKIAYAKIVPEITEEPDYKEAFEAVKSALK